jgi:hypothetical protein
MRNLSLPFSINKHKEDFILDELNCVLTECTKNKTPEENNISIELFKHSGFSSKDRFLTLLNKVLHGELSPENWQKATIIQLFKKGHLYNNTGVLVSSVLDT